MISFIKNIIEIYFNRNVFLRNVSVLALGTIIGQFILLAITPLLTRLFSPIDFGILALFTSIATILAILTTGRYEFAIALPKDDAEAKNIAKLIFLIGSCLSILFLLLIFFVRKIGIQTEGYQEFIQSSIIFLIPVFTLFTAIYSALQYWVLREKKYKQLATSGVYQICGATLFNVFLGFSGIKYGMVYSLVIGQMIGISALLATIKIDIFQKTNYENIKVVAKRYIEFPRYQILSDLCLTMSQQMTPILFSALFTTTEVGFFSLAYRMLKVPGIVLTSSISSVFRNDAIDVIRITGNCRDLYLSVLKKMVMLSIPIFTIIALFSPWLFSVFFGSEWIISGHYARIICIMMIIDFITIPLNSLFYVVQKQKNYMQIQVLNMLMGVLAIYCGYYWFNNAYHAMLFFAVSNGVFGLICLFKTYQLSKLKYKL